MTKFVLISDDENFYEYIRTKLVMRKNDELFRFTFDKVPQMAHLLGSAVLIVDSETGKEKVFDLISLFEETPIIVTSFNEDLEYKEKCYKLGAVDYITLLISDNEFQARLIPAMSISAVLEKKSYYKKLLEKNNTISCNNEVFLDYRQIIDIELEIINNSKQSAVFLAIAPNDKTKFLIQPVEIETMILSTIRRNDILMTYAPNKYFLILHDINIESAKILFDKICKKIKQKLYAGFVSITNQKTNQLIDEALNKLHQAINSNHLNENIGQEFLNLDGVPATNFKQYRQDFIKKMELIISPVFYQIQQKYANKLYGVTMQQHLCSDYSVFYINNKTTTKTLKITYPGYSKINVDITTQQGANIINRKRIAFEPNEFESGIIEDLLEQFVSDYKNERE